MGGPVSPCKIEFFMPAPEDRIVAIVLVFLLGIELTFHGGIPDVDVIILS